MLEKSRAQRSSQWGSTTIEFLFIALTLVLVMLAGIEMDRMLFVYANLADAAKAGARYAIVRGSDRTSGSAGPGANPSNIVSLVQSYATGINPNNLTVNVTYPDGSNTVGSRVKVDISYAYDPWLGLLTSNLLGLNLKASSQGIITW